MSAYDFEYICKSISHLSGIPVRIFRNGEEYCRCFPAGLPRDPMELNKEEILAMDDHVGYFATPLFHYYGVLNVGEIKLVAGPTSQIMAEEQKLRELAFRLDVPKEDVQDFVEGMNAIVRMPVETLLQMLCTLNHFLNRGEKLRISDLAIHDAEQAFIKSGVEQSRTDRVYAENASEQQAHNTLAIEDKMMEIVSEGNTAALREMLAQMPAIQGGRIAKDQLRQLKNTFIVTATLVSRAAIRGGMKENDAFTLSDAYIQRAELLQSHGDILNLQFHMLLEYTEQVEKLHFCGGSTELTLEVANYVRHHLSEPVSVTRWRRNSFSAVPTSP